MIRFYAGIGARTTPPNVLSIMRKLGATLYDMGYLLRSGDARGADKAFAKLSGPGSEIFHPNEATPAAIKLAEFHHPAWHNCDNFVRRAHGRNAMILLGADLCHPVDFVVCWTPRGHAVGGTGQTIRMAEAYGIPVFNLYHPGALQALLTGSTNR